MTLPDTHVLPAPLWLITVLHIFTLGLHLLAMNFVLGGVVLVLAGRMPGKWENPVVRRFAALFPTVMAATVTLGVAPLLFVQLAYHGPFYSATIVSGWFWFLVPAAVIVSYYLFYAAASAGRPAPRRLLLAVALLGLLYVALVYSGTFSMAERTGLTHSLYAGNASGWVLNPALGQWGFRWLHMIAGAITVGGFFIGLVGRNDEPAFRLGKVAFLSGMVAAMLLGLAYVGSLGDHLLPYMRSPGVWLILLAATLSLGSVYFYFQRRFVLSAVLLVPSLFTMVTNRHVLRRVVLGDAFDPGAVPVRSQWGVFALFAVCLVAGLAAVGIMLRWYLASLRRPAR